MKHFIVGIALIAAFLGSSLLQPAPVQAAVAPGCSGSIGFLGFPTWFKYLDVGPKEETDDEGRVVTREDCAITGPMTTKMLAKE